MTTARATKNTIVELIVLTLAQSTMKDMGLTAMRGVLQSDPRLAVLDGSVDLECVWELLEGQPGFEPAATLAPFCFLKTLEPRLQISIKLPTKLGELSETDIVKNATACRPRREDIDRVIEGDKEGPTKRIKPASLKAPPIRGSMTEELTTRKKILAGVSAAVVLASLVIVGHSIFGELGGEPKFTKIEPAAFTSEIPLRSAEKWGGEVHASLADPAWLKQPEDKRRKQLESAMQRLADQQLNVLIIEDDTKRPRATAQLFGKPPKVFVRFY